jgi:hypothetical protein
VYDLKSKGLGHKNKGSSMKVVGKQELELSHNAVLASLATFAPWFPLPIRSIVLAFYWSAFAS